MNLQTAGPGKTAPKLCKDFLYFDPTAARPNVLVDHAPPQGEGPQPTPHFSSCKHEYTKKASQSDEPPLDLRSDGSTRHRLAVVCKRCRIHADIKIDCSYSANPCPSSQSPVHHFRPAINQPAATSNRITYEWQCSVEECHARLSIIYRRPRTKNEDKELLTNPDRLKRRYEELVEAEPEREGMRLATDMEALSRLRRYIRDSLDPKHNKRQFPANNKRFQEAFGMSGRDCYDLFVSLGFKYADDFWHLPNPEPVPDRWHADGSSQRESLEDAEMELLGWMLKIAAETGAVPPAGTDSWISADGDIERTLAAQGYQRYTFRRPSNEELPFFNSLGTLPDFGDTLIEFAYDRQTLCDPGRTAYYFECLQVIASGRSSEQLQMKVAMLESQDTVSRRDVNAAFRAFNILPRDKDSISAQEIIDRFQAHLGDQAPAAQQRSREHLYKIGQYRGSKLLISASQQSVETYEDALTWLGNGVTKDTPDESLLAVLGVKLDGNPADAEIGRNAISTIAKARQSNFLNNWLLTGRQENDSMSVDEALRHLGIEEKLDKIDPTIFPPLFTNARQDRPGDMTEKAIATIQQSLRGDAGSGGGSSGVQHAPATWPVGLVSHGNTCYLNSLLQYYFSIQQVRDIILNYEKYQMDAAGEATKTERVGHMQIGSLDIKGGQRFAQDLKYLFERMIKEHGSTVRPDDDLVCRAFLEAKEYHLMAAAANKIDIANAASAITNGIPEPSNDSAIDTDTTMNEADIQGQSSASSQTLQGDAEVSMVNGEKVLTPPSSPDLGAQNQQPQPQPEHKPPLPPRNAPRRQSTFKEVALERAKMKAREQQDVTEVHDMTMQRLRSGMTPRGQDPSGEQQDPLRDIFSIGYLETKVKNGTPQAPETKFDTSITCDVPKEDSDIYSTLDRWFDLSPPNEEDLSVESYRSIRALPPVLQISTPRIDFNRELGQAFKSTKVVRLEDEIYLDRYIDYSHPDTLRKRRACWDWKKQLSVLKEERARLTDTGLDMNSPTAFLHTAEYLAGLDEVNQELEAIGSSKIEADGDITAALTTAAQEQAARLPELDAEIDGLQKKINTQFQDMNNIKYRLAAAFFHRGNTGSGHYWIYIYDFKNKLWRKYNDETVEEHTQLDDIYSAKAYAQGTPTYIVYVAEDKLDIVQPVCRDPEPAPEPPPKDDVQMGGAGWIMDGTDPWTSQDPDVVNKPRSQMEALDPTLMDTEMVADSNGTEWDDKDRQVANAKF